MGRFTKYIAIEKRILKMRLTILSFIFIVSNISYTFAQSSDTLEFENFWANGKEVGINVTNLASRFVPFNLAGKDDVNQFIALKTKWYGSGSMAFIINFGINLGDSNSDAENKVFLSLGYERRRNISNKWKYVTGWELAGTNLGNNTFDNSPYIAVSKPYGIEYHFFDNFYISTEARLLVGFGDGFQIRLSYPNSIFFNMLIE
jgi:hypothetical protein